MSDNALAMDVLSLEESMKAMEIALQSNTPIHFVGSPGIGKSAIVEHAAKKLDYELVTLLLSQCDPTDIGGFPVVKDGEVSRFPLGPVKRACVKPVILFLDEISCASPAVQGASLQLIYNRYAGDARLHKDTKIVAASNRPDESAGGWEIAPPLMSRLTQIRMVPNVKEVQKYFYSLGTPDSMLRTLATDFAATLESSPNLLQLSPPKGAQAAGMMWGNPRSWERAITFCAHALESGVADNSKIFMAGLAGNVGDNPAAAWNSIRKIREKLPGIKDILKNPLTAITPDPKAPDALEVGVAILGVIAQVALQDPCAAWTYSARMEVEEMKVAVLNIIGRFDITAHKGTKWYKDADKAQSVILSRVGKVITAN